MKELSGRQIDKNCAERNDVIHVFCTFTSWHKSKHTMIRKKIVRRVKAGQL